MKYILLLLPMLAHARITINIVTTNSKHLASVEFSGKEISIISDKERETFQINDYQLKSAVEEKYGQRPDDVFVKSPTPWNDLYSRFKWIQVKRILSPIKATVIGIHTEPVILSTEIFVNNGTNDVKYTTSINQQLEDTVTESWTKGGELSIGQDISVSISFVEATTSVSFTSAWGQESSVGHTVTVGANTAVEVVLKPGTEAEASLRATRGTMEIQIDYLAKLVGDVAVHYANKRKNSYFWAYDIKSVMAAKNLSNEFETSEIMKIGFYSDTTVVVDDHVPVK